MDFTDSTDRLIQKTHLHSPRKDILGKGHCASFAEDENKVLRKMVKYFHDTVFLINVISIDEQ